MDDGSDRDGGTGQKVQRQSHQGQEAQQWGVRRSRFASEFLDEDDEEHDFAQHHETGVSEATTDHPQALHAASAGGRIEPKPRAPRPRPHQGNHTHNGDGRRGKPRRQHSFREDNAAFGVDDMQMEFKGLSPLEEVARRTKQQRQRGQQHEQEQPPRAAGQSMLSKGKRDANQDDKRTWRRGGTSFSEASEDQSLLGGHDAGSEEDAVSGDELEASYSFTVSRKPEAEGLEVRPCREEQESQDPLAAARVSHRRASAVFHQLEAQQQQLVRAARSTAPRVAESPRSRSIPALALPPTAQHSSAGATSTPDRAVRRVASDKGALTAAAASREYGNAPASALAIQDASHQQQQDAVAAASSPKHKGKGGKEQVRTYVRLFEEKLAAEGKKPQQEQQSHKDRQQPPQQQQQLEEGAEIERQQGLTKEAQQRAGVTQPTSTAVPKNREGRAKPNARQAQKQAAARKAASRVEAPASEVAPAQLAKMRKTPQPKQQRQAKGKATDMSPSTPAHKKRPRRSKTTASQAAAATAATAATAVGSSTSSASRPHITSTMVPALMPRSTAASRARAKSVLANMQPKTRTPNRSAPNTPHGKAPATAAAAKATTPAAAAAPSPASKQHKKHPRQQRQQQQQRDRSASARAVMGVRREQAVKPKKAKQGGTSTPRARKGGDEPRSREATPDKAAKKKKNKKKSKKAPKDKTNEETQHTEVPPKANETHAGAEEEGEKEESTTVKPPKQATDTDQQRGDGDMGPTSQRAAAQQTIQTSAVAAAAAPGGRDGGEDRMKAQQETGDVDTTEKNTGGEGEVVVEGGEPEEDEEETSQTSSSDWFAHVPAKLRQKLEWTSDEHLNAFMPSLLDSHMPLNFRRAFTISTSLAKSTKLVLRHSIEQLHCKEVPFRTKHPCSMYWCCGSFKEVKNTGVLNTWVSRIPGLFRSARKVPLARILQRTRRLFPESFDFCPRTWRYPSEYEHFCRAHDRRVRAQRRGRVDPKKEWIYIVKPDDGAHGTGIFLTKDPRDVRFTGLTREHVIQDYIANPLLMDGYKFDLRIYALITSVAPLEVYLHKEGMARFCTMPYEPPTDDNMEKTYMHLTNYTLNKNSEDFVREDRASDEGGGERSNDSNGGGSSGKENEDGDDQEKKKQPPRQHQQQQQQHQQQQQQQQDRVRLWTNESQPHATPPMSPRVAQLKNGTTNTTVRQQQQQQGDAVAVSPDDTAGEEAEGDNRNRTASTTDTRALIVQDSGTADQCQAVQSSLTSPLTSASSPVVGEDEELCFDVLGLLEDRSTVGRNCTEGGEGAGDAVEQAEQGRQADGDGKEEEEEEKRVVEEVDARAMVDAESAVELTADEGEAHGEEQDTADGESGKKEAAQPGTGQAAQGNGTTEAAAVTVEALDRERHLFQRDDPDGALNDDDVGSKRTLTSVMNRLAADGNDVQLLWSRICAIVSKTTMALAPLLSFEAKKALPKQSSMQPKCFQIVGFDVLIDEQLHPHLIEINANPSLRIDAEVKSFSPEGYAEVSYEFSPVDAAIKIPVVRDGVALLMQKLHRMHVENPGSVSEPMSKSQRDYDLHMLRQRRLREIKEKAKLKEVEARQLANERRKRLLEEKLKRQQLRSSSPHGTPRPSPRPPPTRSRSIPSRHHHRPSPSRPHRSTAADAAPAATTPVRKKPPRQQPARDRRDGSGRGSGGSSSNSGGSGGGGGGGRGTPTRMTAGAACATSPSTPVNKKLRVVGRHHTPLSERKPKTISDASAGSVSPTPSASAARAAHGASGKGEHTFGYVALHELLVVAGREERGTLNGLRDVFSKYSGRGKEVMSNSNFRTLLRACFRCEPLPTHQISNSDCDLIYLDAIRAHDLPKANLNFDGFCDAFLRVVSKLWPDAPLRQTVARITRHCLGKL